MKIKTLLLSLLGSALLGSANAQSPGAPAETKYLAFQLMTVPGAAGPMPFAENPPSVPTKGQMEAFVRELTKAIGMTGDARHKLAFSPTHLRFDESDEETRRLIHDAFVVARENDVAVAFHLDDSMYWGKRTDLLSNPDNIETADWKQIPNTGRRIDWGLKPSKFAPQMCFNSPAIVAAVKARGALIGAEVKKELDVLRALGKEHLFAGIIAGSETMIGRDFDTDRPLGYRALSRRGFSESNPPNDADAERVSVVKEFIELWANALHAPGIPSEKIYCHIAFTAQGLDHKEKTGSVSTFARPEVAFSSAYRPGFSTYPSGTAFKEIWGHIAAHGSPAWISAEGTNVAPGSGMSSGITMETYLGRMFNHGAVMVNIFAWGIGGEAMRDHFFRRAAEGPEPLAAYGKFLRGETLNESDPTGFSVELLEAKMHRIQSELPAWMQKTGKQAEAMALMQKVQSLVKEKKWQEVDKAADEVLALMKGESPAGAKVEPPSAQGGDSKPPQTPPSDDLKKRITEKVERVKAGVRQWMESGRDPSGIAQAMHEKFKPLMDAGNIAEAEAELDGVLKLLTQDATNPDNSKEEHKAQAKDSPPAASPEAVHQRIAAKVERIKEGVQKMAEGGSDPSAILTTMHEKVGPLLDAGKAIEAEPELDRVLKALGQEPDAGPESVKPAAPKAKADAPSGQPDEATHKRLTEKVERVKAGARKWAESGRDPSAIGQTMEEKFKPLMEAGKIVEAEAVLDSVLEQLTKDTTSTESPPASADTVHQRVAAKIERIKEGVRKLAESGGDPSAIRKTMEEKVGPLIEAGKFIEAEPELDRALEQLKPDGKSTGSSPAPVETVHTRIVAKIELIKEGVKKAAEGGTDSSAILKTTEEKLGPLIEAGKFVEAEAELDRVLEQLKHDAK